MILRAHIICNNKINGHPEADKYGQGSSAGWLAAGPGRVLSCCARTYSDRGKARLLLVHDIKDECIDCFDTEEQR